MRFANHGRELKCNQNIFQPTLAVSAQHNERLRLKFITFRTTIVLQKYMTPFEQLREDEERKRHHVMIRVAMNNRIYRFRHRYGSNLAAFLILFSVSFESVGWLSSIRNEKARSCIDGICVSGDSECTQRPTSSRPPITA